ncbi:hypothetical protein SAMN05216233_1058 [Desulfoluna spongiiphila]|uniref:Uncharacterized protein n=1 Tax=Desulfoluna spongiiphila TaxID=419481 RepID=A0A1G5DUM4_9BACT|nr:hypothetical protein SAMN05216233_1058 [Desulfoluna spongiiphila]
MRVTEDMLLQWYLTIVISASFAQHYVNRHIIVFGHFFDSSSCFLIFKGQIEMAIKAIKATGCSHVKIIHT